MILESYWVLKILRRIFNQKSFLFLYNYAFCKSGINIINSVFIPTFAENGKSLPTLCPVLTSVFKNSCNHTVVKPSKQTKSGLYFEHLISVKNLWPNFSKIIFVNAVSGHLHILSVIFHFMVLNYDFVSVTNKCSSHLILLGFLINMSK